MRELFVVVSGEPASGKSTLANPLAGVLGLPLLAKDTIKEALGDALGAADVDESKRLGRATMQVLLALARANSGAVLESTWIPALARDEIGALPSPVVEVYCDVPIDVAKARYAARSGSRHPVHFDGERLAEGGWDASTGPIDGGWPVIRVDTTRPVDIDALARRVLEL